jgi:hypothetical protein
MNLVNFDIKKIDVVSQIESDNVVSVIGKRGSGKSVIMLNILYQKKYCFHAGLVISPTEDGNYTWRAHVPPSYIHTRYDSELVLNFLNSQKKIAVEIAIAYRKRHNREITPKEIKKLLPYAFIVLDDCAAEKKFNTDVGFRTILLNGRHFNIFLIISLQDFINMNADLRGQMDWVFFRKERRPNRIRSLYNEYFGSFGSQLVFKRAIDQMTTNHKSMVLDNRSDSSNINEYIYWYKGDFPIDHYILGSRSFILNSMKNYNPNYMLGDINYNDLNNETEKEHDNNIIKTTDDGKNDFTRRMNTIKNPNELNFVTVE